MTLTLTASPWLILSLLVLLGIPLLVGIAYCLGFTWLVVQQAWEGRRRG